MPSIVKNPTLHLVLLWCLLIAGKLWYRQADAADVDFLLAPTAKVSGMLLGLNFQFLPGKGYFSEATGILISQDCSGFNFLLIAVLAGFLALMPRWKHSQWLIPSAVLLGFGLCLIANVARICCLVLTDSLLQVPEWLHLGIGVAVYLSLLIPYSMLLSNHHTLLLYANRTR